MYWVNNYNAQHCGQALQCVASIACAIPMATISSKRLQSRTAAKKKTLCRSWLERWRGNYCTRIVVFLWLAALLCQIQPGDHYARAKALRTLLLLQAVPLKCALAQTRHCKPDSQASTRPDMLKHCAHTIATC